MANSMQSEPQPSAAANRQRGPIPPDDILIRIGVDPTLTPEARIEEFERVGEAAYRDILGAAEGLERPLAALDFGCGSGRVMRWFLQHGDIALTGCDIHQPTIDWMVSSYPAGVRLYANNPEPPLPELAETFDLVYCGSVFSHLPDWAPWLLELRRVLKPGGLLVASIHGRGLWQFGEAGKRGVPWDEDRTGLLVERYGDDFDDSWGPAVYVSEWWLREHWGRAFEIVRFEPTGFALPDNRSAGQAWVVARRPEETSGPAPTLDELRAPGGDPREVEAALRGQWLAYEESSQLRHGG
jgi:SAM-dependent methyltransferase